MNPDTDPNYEPRLNVKIEELMKKGGDYYPFEQSNFDEVMELLCEEQKESLCKFVGAGMGNIFLYETVKLYWQRLARIEAEARLEEEYDSCERCGGIGCSKCNDKEEVNHE